MTTNQDKAAAERERKARIKRAREHLDALPAEDRAAVVESAEEKEAQARDAGSRRAHIAFVEDALVAWEIGGVLMAAHARGEQLSEKQVEKVVRAASKKYRGTDVDVPDTTDDALAGVEVVATRADVAVATGDAEGLASDAAVLAVDEVGKMQARAVALRAKGLTVAEVAKELAVSPSVAHELCGTTERGTAKATKAATATRAKRPAREHRTHQGERQEKCPDCQQWRPAEQDAAGKYVKAADFREGRADCRACYNRRWLEAKQRREGAKKQGASK